MENKYWFFGEFGFLFMIVLPALEIFFERNENEKITILTYDSFAKIIKNHFGDKVTVESLNWKFIEDHRCGMKYYENGFEKHLESIGWPNHISCISSKDYENMRDLTDVSKGHFFWHFPSTQYFLKRRLEYNIGNINEKFINIFPRKRVRGPHRNVPMDFWKRLLKEIDNLGYRIVIHGYKEEMLDIRGDSYIFPNDSLEQIMYLNNSKITVSPDSGFFTFALCSYSSTKIIF